jgi:hypothetical protein
MAPLRYSLAPALFAAICLHAQAPAPPPDTVVFNNGEKLIGHLIRANGGVVVFKSDTLGEVNLSWGNIAELHSSKKFAMVGKDIKLSRRSDLSKVPKGSVSVAAKTVTLTPDSGAPIIMPVAEATHLIDTDTFQNVILHNPGFTEDWKGAISAGASLVEATQQSRTFTAAINLVRAIPTENWLDPRNRTLFDFSATSGLVNQPNTPTVKTDIFHADAERDQYFRGKDVYAFGQASFDHNFSQGLDLQQNYGGGIGWTAIKEANTTLDLKGSVSYTRQSFQIASSDHNLIGSVFAENFAHKFKKGIQVLQGVSFTPAWNEAHAYAANAFASLNFPVYKRLAFSISLQDMFLNDPPPGFKKNSFQLTTGLTYSFK